MGAREFHVKLRLELGLRAPLIRWAGFWADFVRLRGAIPCPPSVSEEEARELRLKALAERMKAKGKAPDAAWLDGERVI